MYGTLEERLRAKNAALDFDQDDEDVDEDDFDEDDEEDTDY